MFDKILIANRGEIALRIIRACQLLGIQTVAVYSEADYNSKHLRFADETVCIGPGDVTRSYLNINAIIAAAEVTDAQAIHPGYGLLSENAAFAQQVEKSGFVFIGPHSQLIGQLGDKIAAREVIGKFGIKSLRGTQALDMNDMAQVRNHANEIGFPVIIKAAAGGGGRGMRIVKTESALSHALPVVAKEAGNAFGDSRLYLEKYISSPRHIEIQTISDKHGNAIHLGSRDCSIQRRHQKIIEESPPIDVDLKMIDSVAKKCAVACKKLKYTGCATFEFIYDGSNLHFIEINTRLQVEHPVTEMVSNIDIVAEQISVAYGNPLSYKQSDVDFRGHSIECRINAENAVTFLPSPGKINFFHPPGGPGIRLDSHIYSGYEIPPYYDSLIGKIISHGASRTEAIDRMLIALNELIIEGIDTNIPLHQRILRDSSFRQQAVNTGYLETLLE